MAFASFCHLNLKLAHSTIKFNMVNTYPSHGTFMAANLIKNILKGILRLDGRKPSSHQPIDRLDTKPFKTTTNDTIKRAIFLAFYGFLRPNDFLVRNLNSSANMLKMSDLVKVGDHYVLTLRQSKTNQFGPPVDIPLYPTNNKWCPVQLLDRVYPVLSGQVTDAPLLSLHCRPLTMPRFAEYLRILLGKIGCDLAAFTGHSFHIGAATAASSLNIPVHIIKRLGQWKSSAYYHYIPQPEMSLDWHLGS